MSRKLNRETLRHLTLSQMSRAVGGTQVRTDSCESWCIQPPEIPPFDPEQEETVTIQSASTNARCTYLTGGR